MNLTRVYIYGFGAVLMGSAQVVACADAVLCRASSYRRGKAVLLDTILGPEEDVEYVSTTAPSSPPPTS